VQKGKREGGRTGNNFTPKIKPHPPNSTKKLVPAPKK
jgi:hypothetical protein